jgi:hypothetical protein
MAKQPEFKKYLPLDEWFSKQDTSKKHLELSLAQVEEIVGNPLPKSSSKPSWWTNVAPKIQSHRTAWLNNGWKVSEYNEEAKIVKFVRA